MSKKYELNEYKFFDYFTIVLLVAVILMFLQGCSRPQPQVVVKYKYIERKCPELKTYPTPQPLIITAYNKNDKVCVREWQDACLPKTEFLKLAKYIKQLRSVCDKYKQEIIIYNQKIAKEPEADH